MCLEHMKQEKEWQVSLEVGKSYTQVLFEKHNLANNIKIVFSNLIRILYPFWKTSPPYK